MSDGAARARSGVLGVLVVLALVGTTRLAATTWLQFHNTVHNNGRWLSSKIGLERSVMGSAAMMVTRTATYGNRLNLGVWFGFQDMRWHEPVALRELDAAIAVNDDRYISVWFGGSARGRVGIRLSKHERLPSAWWIEGPDGLRTHLEEISPPVVEEMWQDLELRFGEDGSFVMRLNEHEVVRGKGPIAEPGSFGFAGGLDETWVDNVRFQTRDGREEFDDFTHHDRSGTVHAAIAAVLALLSLGAARMRREGDPAAFPALLVLGTIAASVALVQQWDLRANWQLYPDDQDIDYGPYPQGSLTGSDVTDELLAAYGEAKPEGMERILFLGTSQTRGSGATTLEDTWVRRTCALLNEAPGRSVQCMNSGLPGSASPELWKLYRDHWVDLEPDVLVAVLGNNDTVPEDLRVALDRVLTLNRERGIETRFVLEPTSSDMGPTLNDHKHAVLIEVAAAHGLPAPLDMQAHLYDQRDRAVLWRDFVHLSDAGQRLFAEHLAEHLAPPAPEETIEPGKPAETSAP
ncbi:MAG: SGNH/GDSL hydrolase family protein [Deltaproteobacteria bacterium]|nr:SGNH/GDSL hydrolase family protein [Deltaproteobacteria bacterium]